MMSAAKSSRSIPRARAMMLSELETMRIPLRKLQALSRYLNDEPADLAIRQSVAALVLRMEALRIEISLPPLKMSRLLTSSARLEATDDVLGNT